MPTRPVRGLVPMLLLAQVYPYATLTGDDFADTVKDLVNDQELLDFQKRVLRAARDGG